MTTCSDAGPANRGLSTCISRSSIVGGRGTITGRTTAGEYRGTSMTRIAVPVRSAAARSAWAARRQAVEHQILRRPRRGSSSGKGASIGRPQRGHEGPAPSASIPPTLKRPDEMLPFRDLSARSVWCVGWLRNGGGVGCWWVVGEGWTELGWCAGEVDTWERRPSTARRARTACPLCVGSRSRTKLFTRPRPYRCRPRSRGGTRSPATTPSPPARG